MGIKIIAEAGVNHNGSLSLAKELALRARDAGADIVKYQTFIPEKMTARAAKKATYQETTTGNGSQLDMLKELCLDQSAFEELKAYCDSIGIQFLSTAFDLESAAFLLELGIAFWKIPSGEITNLPYLEMISKSGLPVVMSTGMASMEEVGEALDVVKNGTEDITVLHCTTQYPTPLADVNLKAMDALRERFGYPVGYSDHTKGIIVPIAAAARGAVVLEKHFTLSRDMKGPDHMASLEPNELSDMVQAVRDVETMLGDGVKIARSSEVSNKGVARKSIVAAVDIQKGQKMTAELLTAKRPGNGISPMRWYDVVGKQANRDYIADEMIDAEVLSHV